MKNVLKEDLLKLIDEEFDFLADQLKQISKSQKKS